MKIQVLHISPFYPTIIQVPPESKELFSQLVNRAMNCWDNAPPELKEFADILEYGKPLQDYYSMDQPMNTKPEPVEVISPASIEALLPCEECGRPGFGHLFSCPKFGKTKK